MQDEWDESFTIRHELLPDEFVVMPNHFHGIVQMVNNAGADNDVIVETPDLASLL